MGAFKYKNRLWPTSPIAIPITAPNAPYSGPLFEKKEIKNTIKIILVDSSAIVEYVVALTSPFPIYSAFNILDKATNGISNPKPYVAKVAPLLLSKLFAI